VTATAELPPILTPRTFEALRPYLVSDVADELGAAVRDFFERFVAPLYAPGPLDFDAAVLRVLSDAAQPRTTLVLTFLRALDPAQGGDAFREAFELTRGSLDQEGWRLGDASEALQLALDQLLSIIPNAPPPPAVAIPPELTATELGHIPPEIREALDSVLLRAVEIDLCVLGALAYLQGDIQGADPTRVRRACEIAAVTTSMVCSRYSGLSSPELSAAERGALLHALAGSWPNSDDDERALERIYEDRTRDR
jgi:hypothetical protein